MLPTSIRRRLPLSYAAIALLAVLALGLVLLTILRGYYRNQEQSYLVDNASVISLELARLLEADLPAAALQAQLQNFSFLTQTRVKLLDADGLITADSGEPQDQRQVLALSVEIESNAVVTTTGLSTETVTFHTITETLPIRDDVTRYAPFLYLEPPGNSGLADQLQRRTTIVQRRGPDGSVLDEEIHEELNAPAADQNAVWVITQTHGAAIPDGFGPESDEVIIRALSDSPDFISVLPANRTPYGYRLSSVDASPGQRTDQVVRQTLYDSAGNVMGVVELSQGPAYGRDIVAGVAWGWAIAGSAAVLIAAVAGWLISRHISRPLLALTDVTNQMARGDLSARADVTRADELGTLAGSFNTMAAQVEETVSTLRRFVADAAHELHTPLTALQTNLELAAGPDSVSRATFLAEAQSQVKRLESLTANLLDLSRLETPTTPITMNTLDLHALIRDGSEQYASQADQAELHFTLSLDSGAANVIGNQQQLRRLLDNLIANAIKFTAPGGEVRLSTTRDSRRQQVIVKIEDTGIGLIADDVPQLFQRFHRGRNAAAYPGNGLGLAIVKAIVTRHGGQVWAENRPHGACFSFYLPLEEGGENIGS
ncbi:MAG: HAMP domain-containing histidine kinase [Anaerolineae bacterium]|nr:HAMP domain-containing histidine kinase [Anaerolineae bacterium]